MSTYEIHQALVQSFIDLDLGYGIAHENADFDPPDDAPWIELTNIPNTRESLTKAELDEETGIFQATFYQPSGESLGEALGVIDTILAYYKHNQKITAGSQTVVIINSGRNAGRNRNGWWRVDISIAYKSDVMRV